MMRKQDERKQQFKKGMDQEESRRRREACGRVCGALHGFRACSLPP